MRLYTSFSLFVAVFVAGLCSGHFAYAQLTLDPYPDRGADFDWQDDSAVTAPITPAVDALENGVGVGAGGSYWSVGAGQDLRSVLEAWSKDSGVEFIWDISGHEFSALRSIEMSGGYEEAVRVLLNQYVEHAVRPVARLYLETAERKKTLVISLAD